MEKKTSYETSNDDAASDCGPVKVPTTLKECWHLKGLDFTEDDNEDIAYLNFRLIWPIGIASVISVVFFFIGFAAMEAITHLHYERFALNQILFSYGKTFGFCNNTFPYEEGLWPSFLRQTEIKVLTNICFRVAVCVPIVVRIFVGLVVRNLYREISIVNLNPFINAFNEFSVIFIICEVCSLGLLSIVTIRFDYPKFYNMLLGLFIISSCIHMFLRTILSFVPETIEVIQQISVIIRLGSTILFMWTSAQVFQTHQEFIQEPGCHGYVKPLDAITEYIAILAYIAFSLTYLVDIRDIQFICYPRTSSGECEPIVPENFAKDGKYAHCRSFELQQRLRRMNPPADSEQRHRIPY